MNTVKNILYTEKMKEQLESDREYGKQVRDELSHLAEANDCGCLAEYLKNQNGKKMSGAGGHIFKYRLSYGGRLLYSFGNCFDNIRPDYAGALVLIGYTMDHDEQEYIAKTFDFDSARLHPLEDLINVSGTESSDDVSNPAYCDDSDFSESAFTVDWGNYLDSHKLFLSSDENLANINLDDFDVYLSEEQNNCIDDFIFNDRAPTLVLGGAGTGKTLIALHIMHDLINVDDINKAVYFTQSYELLKSAEKRFGVIADLGDSSSTQNGVMFKNINEFALDILKNSAPDSNHLVNQNKFLEEFPNWLLETSARSASQIENTDWLSVWTEIRGIIKGQLGPEWNRYRAVPRSDVENDNLVKQLIDYGFIIENPDDRRYLLPCGEISVIKSRLETLPDKDPCRMKALKLAKYFGDVDTSLPDIGRDEYYKLSDEECTVPPERRKFYWELYELYSIWLKQHGYSDENDIARQAIGILKKSKFEGFQLVTVDEVQDYTEMQLYLLNLTCSNLICSNHTCDKKGSILLVGDGNQNVNPTLFRISHLKKLYRATGTPLVIRTLSRDYRCPCNVVKVCNNLNRLRREKIARQHDEQEIPLESIISESSAPYRLEMTEPNLVKMLLKMDEYPSTIVLVPDEQTKCHVVQTAKKIGIHKSLIVHTVSEIKGMEYRYVLCYNLIGRYAGQWSAIMSEEHIRKQTAERYFFNLLYVGMTRTRMCLGFMDSKTEEGLEEVLDLRYEPEFDPALLHFNELDNSPDDWFSTGRIYEDGGNYEDAKRMYVKAGAPREIIHRCDAKIARAANRYNDAFKYALFSEDDELLREIAEYLPKDSPHRPLATAILHPENSDFAVANESTDLREYFLANFSEFETQEQEKLMDMAIFALNVSIDCQLEKLERFFAEGYKNNAQSRKENII